MGLIQEGLRRSGEIRNALTPVNLNRSEIKTNKLPLTESRLEVKIREISSMLSPEKKERKETEEQDPQEPSKNGFEPFVSPEPTENPLFVNGYNGNFAQQMELNRKGIEKVLKIAHLEGQVFLTTLSPNRQRSIEANPDGSVSAKKRLFFGEKPQEDNKDNPPHRVISVPEGWRIEINDQQFTQELTEKKLSGRQLQRAFIERFNGQLKDTLKECVWREKFSSEKDKDFKGKVFFSLLPILGNITIQAPLYTNYPFIGTFITVGLILLAYGLTNLLGQYIGNKVARSTESLLKEADPSFSPRRYPRLRENFDSFWEYFMPPVEIDKVARALAFLSLKGRKLVREVK